MLRVGIAGCGDAGTAHARALAAAGNGFRVTHVHDPDPARAASLAAGCGVDAVDFDTLLRAVDCVCVATPDAFHAEQLVAACRAGVRGAVVEPPACLSAAEARAVQRECDAHGMRVLVAVDGSGFEPAPSALPAWATQQRTASAAAAIRSAFARQAALLQACRDDDPPESAAALHARLLVAAAGGTVDRVAVWQAMRRLLDGAAGDDPRVLAAAVAHLDEVESAMRNDVGAAAGPGVVCIGAGVMGTVHAGLAAARARVLRVASRTPGSARQLALLVGAEPHAASDPGVLDGARAVVVCTPPRAHFAHALAAVAAGCDVLVEKPMTATVGEARRLAEEVRRRGVRFVYAENWAYQPAVRRAVEVFRGLGVDDVEVVAHWPMPQWLPLEDPGYGGAAVYDGGVHAIELARLLLGRPRALRVDAALEARGSDVDLAATLHVEFAGGTHAHITVDLVSAAPEVVARGGGAELRLAPEVELRAAGRRVALSPAHPPNSWTALGYTAQMRALLGVEPVLAGVEDGLAVMEIVAAAYLSAGRGSAVALPYDGPLDCTPLQLWRGTPAS